MMRLPFVSREYAESLERQLVHERETSRMLRGALSETLSCMRYPVAAPATPAPTDEPVIIPLADPIRDVIREQASDDGRENHQLASHLRKYARQLKREGKSDDEIVGMLVAWQTSEAVD